MTRHPGGRTCRRMLPLALLMLPYALVREGVYQLQLRRSRKVNT